VSDAPREPRIAPRPSARTPAPLNIFATLAHNRPLSKGFLALGGHLLTGGVLPARERELVILRTGWRSGSEYEFGQHTRIGREVGLLDEEIARVADCGEGAWDPADQALVDLVDELCEHDVVAESTWSALAARFDDAAMLELLVLVGYYRLVSGMLNSVGVALEPDAPGWPEGARPVRRAPRAT
jgi:alkylhydroperoxidase family enzyme